MDKRGGMADHLTLAPWSWVWPDLDLQLNVSAQAAIELASHRQESVCVEKGGQLFVDTCDPRGLLLAVATPPHPADRADVTWLDMDPDRCRVESSCWHRRGLQLIGVWHTHAEINPQLSSQDLKSLRSFGQANGFFPLAVIVGQASDAFNIRAWSVRGERALLADVRDSD